MRLACIAVALALITSFSLQPARGEDDWDAQGRPREVTPDMQRAANMEINVIQQICGGLDQAQAKKKVESQLAMRVGALERAGGLSKKQAEILRVAGNEDAQRFLRELDDFRQKYRGLNWNDRKFQEEVYPKMLELQSRFNGGLFADGSLFQKVLRGLARDEPAAPYMKEELDRRQSRFHAMIEMTVVRFENGVSMTESQRQKFLKLLFDELKPPHNFGRRTEYVVFYQMSKIDEAKIRPIFDDAQWRTLSMWLRNAKEMERQLKKQGFVP